MKKLLSSQLFRYALIGIVTNLIDIGTYILLTNLGVNYLVADLINNPLVLVINYFGHRKFTFSSKKTYSPEIAKYIANLIFMWGIATALLALNVEFFKLGLIGGKLLQIVILPLINFQTLRKIVFRKPAEASKHR